MYAADPNSHIKVHCQYCGTEFNVNLSANDEYEREARVLYYNQGWGAVYRDARVFAASHWVTHRPLVKRWATGDFDKEKVESRKKAREERLQAQRYDKKKKDRLTLEREGLKERAYSFFHRMLTKEQKEFVSHTFPLGAELEAIEIPDSFEFIPGTYKKTEHEESTARKVLYSVCVMEACERVLWNKTLSETKSAMKKLRSIIQKIDDDRAQKAHEKEEEKARQEAEREQERLERMSRATKSEEYKWSPGV